MFEKIDIISIIIGVIGTSIGSLLVGVILDIRKQKRKIEISPTIDDSFNNIKIRITNIGNQEVHIRKITIGYGESRKKQKSLIEVEYDYAIPLPKGGDFPIPINFSRSDLVKSVKKNGVMPEIYGLLWGNVYLSTGRKRFSDLISVDSGILTQHI